MIKKYIKYGLLLMAADIIGLELIEEGGVLFHTLGLAFIQFGFLYFWINTTKND